jgi:hypothetical protein
VPVFVICSRSSMTVFTLDGEPHLSSERRRHHNARDLLANERDHLSVARYGKRWPDESDR